MRFLPFLVFALVALAACDASEPEPRIGDAIAPNMTECLEGVVTVEDLEETQAQAATPTSTVVVSYVGTLVDGTEFDNTSTSTATFSLGRVVTGFRQGIGGRAATDDVPAIAPMRIGERRRIVIPPNLGYGFTGRYDSSGEHVIPRCSTLEFDVTLNDLR